jgi:phosphoglycolate phosphatase-like HAD superfamily hydrolase
MSMADELAGIIHGVKAVLLDFDGPVCKVFAGYPASEVAADLVELLRAGGIPVPSHIAELTDPLELLRWSGSHGTPSLTVAIEDALCAAELRAVASAEPTPFGREVIVAAHEAGLPIAIVTNNSAAAASAYLTAHRLQRYVSPIIGRAYAAPAKMKPNPISILRASEGVGVDPLKCVLIGDSLSDIEGARSAGVRVIAYANKPHKVVRFASAGADVVVTSMKAIAAALTALPRVVP